MCLRKHISSMWNWDIYCLSLFSCCLVTKLCLTLCDPMDWGAFWDFPGKNTGVGCHFLLQGNLLDQGSNLCLLHCRQILYLWATRKGHKQHMKSGYLCTGDPRGPAQHQAVDEGQQARGRKRKERGKWGWGVSWHPGSPVGLLPSLGHQKDPRTELVRSLVTSYNLTHRQQEILASSVTSGLGFPIPWPFAGRVERARWVCLPPCKLGECHHSTLFPFSVGLLHWTDRELRGPAGPRHWAPHFVQRLTCVTLLEPSQQSHVYDSRSVVSNSLWSQGLCPARLLCPWDSPGKNSGVGCHFLLQGIFPTQGLNSGLLHWRRILYHLSHQGSLPATWGCCKSLPTL